MMEVYESLKKSYEEGVQAWGEQFEKAKKTEPYKFNMIKYPTEQMEMRNLLLNAYLTNHKAYSEEDKYYRGFGTSPVKDCYWGIDKKLLSKPAPNISKYFKPTSFSSSSNT